jgi:cell division protein FtsB
MQHGNCYECTRLWNEYALATRHFLNLEGKVQIADISQDERTVARLRPMLETAAAERAELRREIERHESRPKLKVDAAGA